MEEKSIVQELQTGIELQGGKYRIVRKLGQGGFGITYEGVQTGLERPVAIKEFFMKDYCNRDTATSHVSIGSEGSTQLVETFRKKFLKEAHFIAQLDNVPHIIRIYDVFEENGTAYYVMEYLDGGSLKQKVARDGALSEEQALTYISQLGQALSALHQNNILHLDVKPDNVLLNGRGEAVLIDFGISKRYDKTGSQTSSTPVGLSKGYAPSEQYQDGGVDLFTPATDIYSLGATLFYLLVGHTPPDANEVLENGLPPCPARVRPELWKAIEQAMQPRKKDRPQTVEAFLAMIGSGNASAASTAAGPAVAMGAVADSAATKMAGSATTVLNPTPLPVHDNTEDVDNDDDEEEPRRRNLLWPLLALLVVGIAVALFFLLSPDKKKKSADDDEEYTEYVDDEDGSLEIDEQAIRDSIELMRMMEEEQAIRDSVVAMEQYYQEQQRLEKEEQQRRQEAERQAQEEQQRRQEVERQEQRRQEAERQAQEEMQRRQQQEERLRAAEQNNNTIYDVVEQQPTFPGGPSALMQFLASNVHYPVVAEENGVQGKVVCTFVVETDGSISNVTVVRGVDPSLDKEAVRVIKSMPRWNPGRQDGRPVRVKYNVPVNFRLQ